MLRIAGSVNLRGFERVHVAKGQTQHVQITLQPRGLSFMNPAGDRLIAAGDYRVMVGLPGATGNKQNTTAQLEIVGEEKLPE